MKITLINKSDATGGAAVVTTRLLHALRREGADAHLLVQERLIDSPHITRIGTGATGKIPFLRERLRIFLANGLDRADLFKVDIADTGLPLSRHPRVREADVVILNWVNQGLLSLKEIGRMAAQGKRVLWTMHDMWCATGICHHPGTCAKFAEECRGCPFLHKGETRNDLSTNTFRRKMRLYAEAGIEFVAVSSWLMERCRESRLLGDATIHLIPNAVPDEVLAPRQRTPHEDIRLIMGAARLDDPIKGLDILSEALEVLKREAPEVASRLSLHTFGNIRDERNLPNFNNLTHHGPIRDPEALMRLYAESDLVLSPSRYETLPGTLIEGMAQGCVPVAFDSGGQRDIITSPDLGVLVAPPAGFGRLTSECADDRERAAEAFAHGILQGVKLREPELPATLNEAVRANFSARAVARRYLDLIER